LLLKVGERHWLFLLLDLWKENGNYKRNNMLGSLLLELCFFFYYFEFLSWFSLWRATCKIFRDVNWTHDEVEWPWKKYLNDVQEFKKKRTTKNNVCMKLGIWLMNLKKFAARNALRSCDKICVWYKVIKMDVFKHPKSFFKNSLLYLFNSDLFRKRQFNIL
jgi:hypothetical protein